VENLHKTFQENRVLVAPEGFVDERLAPILTEKKICVIEMRYLSDLPFFHAVHPHKPKI
jgi:hypothetical protein